MTPLPKIDYVFFHIHKEAQRHGTMLRKDKTIEPPAAMVVKNPMKPSASHAPSKSKDDLHAPSVMEQGI